MLPLAADRMSAAVLRRDIVVNGWSATDSGPVEASQLELRLDPLAPFLFVRGYFGSERLERLHKSSDRTRVFRRYSRALKRLKSKVFRATLARLKDVPPYELEDELRKEMERRGMGKAVLAWMDQRKLHAPRLRYVARQGRAPQNERLAVLGEVRTPARFREFYRIAARYGDRAMQALLRTHADARAGRCGLVDPPQVTERYRKECADWAELAKKYPADPLN